MWLIAPSTKPSRLQLISVVSKGKSDHMNEPNELMFTVDLTAGEIERRAAIVEALGADWDPVGVLAGEQQAYRLLYSGLDAERQRIYEDLVCTGVLADRQVRRDAA